MDAGAILVAAGSGSRAGALKQFAKLAGRPLFSWALECLVECPRVGQVVVVVPTGFEQAAADMAKCEHRKPVRFVAGGERRQDSVRLGLDALSACEWVVIHDAARPFVSVELVDSVLQMAADSGAASVGTPLVDALKRVEGDKVVETISRNGLWSVQTPQAFRTELIQRAHAEVAADVPDDAAMLETLGGEVRLVEGPRTNIKVTSPDDFRLAEALMRSSGDD
jgi:2-C-methyl-D-erythritol 4-phosphate cytidylyltransferase